MYAMESLNNRPRKRLGFLLLMNYFYIKGLHLIVESNISKLYEILQNKEKVKKQIVFTFDDGYKDN